MKGRREPWMDTPQERVFQAEEMARAETLGQE